jgi:hypothetical protein
MIRTKKFEKWKPRATATLVAIPGEAILEAADIRAAGIQEVAGIRAEGNQGADIPGEDIRAGILEAIPAGAEVIHTQGVEAEDPTGDEELQGRTLKTTRRCSR